MFKEYYGDRLPHILGKSLVFLDELGDAAVEGKAAESDSLGN